MQIKYALAAVLSGALIAIMISINADLTDLVGNCHATVYIHLTGLALCALLLLIARQHPHPAERLPLPLYLGGVVGVGTVVFSNAAVPALGVSITLALGLLGQLVSSLVIDRFGLMGKPVQKMRMDRVLSAALVLLGIAAMMRG